MKHIQSIRDFKIKQTKNKIFIIKTLGKISAVWYNRRYINEFGKAGLINESCCYGYR